jgi:signal transduction histidine kinase
LLALAANAAEALGPAGGSVTVTTRSAGDSVELCVADDGSGMDDETCARIFEPFFTTKFTGRGLGLAGVLGIIEAHSGAIHADSAPGRGTVVTVTLPAAARVPAAV